MSIQEKKTRWIEHPHFDFQGSYSGATYECPYCHYDDVYDEEGTNFCPKCGKIMVDDPDIKTDLDIIKRHIEIKRKEYGFNPTTPLITNYVCGVRDILNYFDSLVNDIKSGEIKP